MAHILKFKSFAGPKDWKFKDPDTGHLFHALTPQALYAQINSYRAQNELEPLEFLPATVEHYLCGLPENSGACSSHSTLKRGVFQYIKGGLLLFKNLMYNSFATQEVADLRAKQCLTCKFNVFPDKDKFLEWADRMAEYTVGDRKPAHYNELGNCEACTCNLRAKVFYKGTLSFSEEEKEKMKEVNCWQLYLESPKSD